eukprot:1385982-Amorphochlora_amoeboformis.AAC.1
MESVKGYKSRDSGIGPGTHTTGSRSPSERQTRQTSNFLRPSDMNSDILKAAEGIVSSAYISQGASSRRSREKLIHSLLTQRCLPRKPWDDRTIALFMAEIASMDSNNFPDNAGVGEREGRVFSRLVAGRHHGLAHGIGGINLRKQTNNKQRGFCAPNIQDWTGTLGRRRCHPAEGGRLLAPHAPSYSHGSSHYQNLGGSSCAGMSLAACGDRNGTLAHFLLPADATSEAGAKGRRPDEEFNAAVRGMASDRSEDVLEVDCERWI